jgi:hypothetical protein
MTEAEQIMKRCQVGTRNYDEANNLHAECYRVIGKLLKTIAELEGQEPYGWVSQHTTKGMYEWQFNKEITGVYKDTAISILPVYTHPPQRTEQEPVAYCEIHHLPEPCVQCAKEHEGYNTTPPQRTWVGLTDEEENEYNYLGPDMHWVIQEIAAKLKEKNT